MGRKNRKPRTVKPCTCAGCLGLPTADPVWGFDLSKVPQTNCMLCHQPIGEEPYILEAGVARFGTMQFLHERCSANPEKDRKQAAEIARRQGYKYRSPQPSQNVLTR